MAQIFHPSANTIARASIFGGVFFIAAVFGVMYVYVRTPYSTAVNVPIEQPIPFSHQHHVGELGIDCRYCHTSVENNAFAGIPPTHTCMSCHSQIFVNAAMLEPVRASYRNQTPIEWNRVHNLPDYVYFNHGINVQKGVGCSTCHGQVNEMPLIWKTQSLHMEWCLNCHRDPAQYVRPREEVFNMDWQPPDDQRTRGQQLVQQYHIQVDQLTNCAICHR